MFQTLIRLGTATCHGPSGFYRYFPYTQSTPGGARTLHLLPCERYIELLIEFDGVAAASARSPTQLHKMSRASSQLLIISYIIVSGGFYFDAVAGKQDANFLSQPSLAHTTHSGGNVIRHI